MGAKAIALVLCATLAACKGEMGPMGPQGEKGDTGAQGVQGPQGERPQRYNITNTIPASGSYQVTLPAIVGTQINQAPALTCYLSTPVAPATWYVISGPPGSSPACFLTQGANALVANVSGATPGHYVALTVIY